MSQEIVPQRHTFKGPSRHYRQGMSPQNNFDEAVNKGHQSHLDDRTLTAAPHFSLPHDRGVSDWHHDLFEETGRSQYTNTLPLMHIQNQLSFEAHTHEQHQKASRTHDSREVAYMALADSLQWKRALESGQPSQFLMPRLVEILKNRDHVCRLM